MIAHAALDTQLAVIALVFIVVPLVFCRMPASLRNWLGQ
jgi:hypothetical protein